MKSCIGIDFGGTKISGILVSPELEVIAEIKTSTEIGGQNGAIDCVKSVIDQLCRENAVTPNHILGIGIGVAGHVDSEEGRVVYCPNIPIENFDLGPLLQKEYGFEVFIENDANAAAVGEKHFGLAGQNRNFVCVTLGTGIGAGIFIDGKIYRGSTGGAGELGHMILDFSTDAPVCGCGNRGCFEALASGIAIARSAKKVFSREEITAFDVAKMAQEGNEAALRILAAAGNIIGIGFANIVNLFNPEKIIVTGSLVENEDLILKPASETMVQRAFSTNAKAVEVIKSNLGNRAGVLGAAALVIQERAHLPCV